MKMDKNNRKHIILGVLLFLVLLVGYWTLKNTGWLELLMDGTAIKDKVKQLGVWGPLVIIVFMTGAIVWSPIPSAPIAMAAGAAYGHTWGTIYVLVGAESGALIAFALARWLGKDVISKWLGNKVSIGWFGSQNAMMALVFVSRLLPFVSFDLISYTAGLTTLAVWRFAIATMGGIIPASFLLAHFGSEMGSGNAQRVVTSVLLILGIAAIPFVLGMLRPTLVTPTHGRDYLM